MQSVPKKTSIAKSDLLNTTAILPRKKRFEEERISFKEVEDIYLYLLFYIFVLSRLNIGQILRLQRLTPFPLRMTGGCGVTVFLYFFLKIFVFVTSHLNKNLKQKKEACASFKSFHLFFTQPAFI